jgi:hypothetical protein
MGLYACYSEKQKKFLGEVMYSTPSGGTVVATEVSPNPGCPNNHWEDKKDLGEVVKFMRRVSYPLTEGE